MSHILPSLQIIDLALYHKKQNILIIGDIHIGYEEALNKQGLLIPRFQFNEIGKRLENIFKTINKKLKKIIINGDIKHEFGTISDQEWRQTLRLLDFLSKHANEIILIKGNHDTILGPIAKKRNIKIVDCYLIRERSELLGQRRKQRKKKFENNIIIIHGHKIPKNIPKNIKTIIIGHEHPAVSLREGPRTELVKCFLKGKWKKYDLIVIPSFNLILEGTNISKEKLLSPFLQQNLNNFDVYIVADNTYYFGKLKNINS